MSASTPAPSWAVCPHCTPDHERRIIESGARRQEREVVLETCTRCERTPGPKTAVDIVRATTSDMISRRRAAPEGDVVRLTREFDSGTREALVEVMLLLAEDLLRERERRNR